MEKLNLLKSKARQKGVERVTNEIDPMFIKISPEKVVYLTNIDQFEYL